MKIVFIHGAGGTKNKWRNLMPFLQQEDTIFLDLPGHGENTNEPFETIEGYAENISEKISEECVIVGHSMGGLIALELAARNPFIKGIVLVASSYQLPVHPKIIQSLAEGTFPPSVFRASYANEVDEQLLVEERKEMELFPTDIARKDFKACDRYKKGGETLENLHQPILAILGDEDRLVPKNTAQELKIKNANLEISIIEGAGHYVALERPEEVAIHILTFKQEIVKGK